MKTPVLASRFSLAAALLTVGGLGFVAGLSIDATSLSGQHDPGPRALPLGLSGVLLVCGLIELVLRGRAEPAVQQSAENSTREWSATRLMVTLALLVAYVSAMSVLGFALATAVFAIASLKYLGARWWSATLVAVTLVVVVRLVFVDRLHVQLPSGMLPIPF